jgi:hypothetical protein
LKKIVKDEQILFYKYLTYSCVDPHLLQNLEDCLTRVPQLIQYFFSIIEVEGKVSGGFSPNRVDMAPEGLKVSSTLGRKSDLSAELCED